MNIRESSEEAAFREKVRRWIAERVPPHLKGAFHGGSPTAQLSMEAMAPLRRLLAAEGWLVPDLPTEYGGAGLPPMQTIILNEEFMRAGVPYLEARGGGIGNITQVLARYATEEQKQRFLVPTLKGEIFWCQGYSEPGSGSDLASLQLRAEPVGDGFVLNGQKIWTSRAHYADCIFLLARTDPNAKRKQEGISFFVLSMKTPGIEVRPLTTIDGRHYFNETFFTDVRVPADGLIGRLNQGWTVAKSLLVHERLGSAGANPLMLERALDNLKQAARTTPQGDGVVWDDAELRERVAAMEMANDCMRYTRYRALTKLARGEQPGDETQIFKFFGSELYQKILETHQEVLGPLGVTWGPEPFGRDIGEVAVSNAINRARTIAGGTAEVQRNVIAKRVLRLPGS